MAGIIAGTSARCSAGDRSAELGWARVEGPTLVPSQSRTGADARQALVISVAARLVWSHAGAPKCLWAMMPFQRSSSMRGWSFGKPLGAVASGCS